MTAMMTRHLAAKLHEREISASCGPSKLWHNLYSDPQLIDGLDIVNELGGHSGCVNALSWSASGNLLASGSDDQHLNIHTYQPSETNNQFRLATTVATGHTQNIFSVKFMPHHNDRTLVTCAGDGEVRVMDVEYSGHHVQPASMAASVAEERRRRGRRDLFNNVRCLSDGDTNCRVYRSHADRVKRIVTESSPHLFLTCSEDGEVRQFDLRQPSSAYPLPNDSRFSRSSGRSARVPPPLISYKRYNLDLNTISCSGSQPHYIALGGTHPRAFLHDRRMVGRDPLQEAGQRLSSVSESADELMGAATRCVRRFAPSEKKELRFGDRGHITACQISDARPDEIVISWSGDNVYSFDLIRDNDEDDARDTHGPSRPSGRFKQSRDGKRKRKVNESDSSLNQDAARASARQRTEETSLRIHYGNGQSEDIPISTMNTREPALTEQEKNAHRLAETTVKLRSCFFGRASSSDPASNFTTALNYAGSILSEMVEVMANWRYPMHPTQVQIDSNQTMRHGREKSRRFVQAAGTIARVLGGRLELGTETTSIMNNLGVIDTRRADSQMSPIEQFRYDFLKAIMIWLDSGVGQLVEAFTRPAAMSLSSKAASRLPIPEDEASIEAIDEYLIPYLLGLASDESIVDFETNQFERDDHRWIYPTEKDAVISFAAATKVPFTDLSSSVLAEDTASVNTQDRGAARTFWALKVARGLLHNASKGVGFLFVDRAFGGRGKIPREVAVEETSFRLFIEGSADPTTSARNNEGILSTSEMGDDGDTVTVGASETLSPSSSDIGTNDSSENENRTANSHGTAEDEEDDNEDDDNADEDIYVSDDDDSEADFSSDPDEEDGVPNLGFPHFIRRSAFERRRMCSQVEKGTICVGPTRSYSGHRNEQTVKDVSYFGPDDDYVVSGSDDGNLFIWDRKTTKLVNILEGDTEVVNVCQPHPYETMLAVSGIDHTIKIFSPDSRAREAARLGRQGISAHDASNFSSIRWSSRHGSRHTRQQGSQATAEGSLQTAEASAGQEDDSDFVAERGLRSRKRFCERHEITQSNYDGRQDGEDDGVLTLPLNLLHLLFGEHGNMGFMPTQV